MKNIGQKNISTLKRNLLNIDEILRIPQIKLLVVLCGNKPLLLDKVIYTEHPLSEKLKNTSIYDYTPKWTKNSNKNNTKKAVKSKVDNKQEENKKENLSFDNF